MVFWRARVSSTARPVRESALNRRNGIVSLEYKDVLTCHLHTPSSCSNHSEVQPTLSCCPLILTRSTILSLFALFTLNLVEMHFLTSPFLTGLLSLQQVRAAPSPLLQPIEARQDASCNTPSDRACWTNGFDINTDYEAKTPFTGVVRDYTLTLTEEKNWKGPDGVLKDVMLVNGQSLLR